MTCNVLNKETSSWLSKFVVVIVVKVEPYQYRLHVIAPQGNYHHQQTWVFITYVLGCYSGKGDDQECVLVC